MALTRVSSLLEQTSAHPTHTSITSGRPPPTILTPWQVTGFGYEHDECWSTNMDLFKEFTHVTQGVRRLGSAAIDMCHVASGERLGCEGKEYGHAQLGGWRVDSALQGAGRQRGVRLAARCYGVYH